MTDSEMERLLKTVETKTLTEEVEKTMHGCFAPLPSGRTRYEVKGGRRGGCSRARLRHAVLHLR